LSTIPSKNDLAIAIGKNYIGSKAYDLFIDIWPILAIGAGILLFSLVKKG